MRSSKPSKTSSPRAISRARRLTIKETLAQAVDCLSAAGIPSAHLDAELLMALVLKKDRVFVLTHGERALTIPQQKRFRKLIEKRFRHYPLAYLTSHKEFYGLDFIVTPDVLVPRPESELLVDEAIAAAQSGAMLIDIGTGSGCLAITLSSHFLRVIALDVSSKALAVARRNALKHHRKNIRFLKSNLLAKLPSLKNISELVITANLPYVSSRLMKEPSIKREPKLALHGGKDGLDLYRKLARQIKTLSDKQITLLCEINPEQKNGFKKIFPKAVFRKDLSGKIRCGIVR